MSKTSTDAMIRVWKIARLSSDTGSLGYPSINILARCALYGGSAGRSSHKPALYQPTPSQADADAVQAIVEKMPRELRQALEARYLGIVRGKRCRDLPHKKRAEALGISVSTYRKRHHCAWQFVDDWLGFDKITFFGENQARCAS